MLIGEMPAVLDDLLPGFEESVRIQAFWEANYERLLRLYPDHFVAVDLPSGEVVSAAKDLAALAQLLRERGLNPRTDVAIEFIADRYGTLLL